jgi:heptosyltransferase I
MKRFWIARLSALGDIVCTLPAAGELKRRFPDCEISWVVSPGLRGVVDACQWVDHVVAHKPGLRPRTWPTGEGEYDAAFDLQGLTKSAVSIAKVSAKVKLGYHWQREASFLFSARVLPDGSSFHVVDQYVDVVRAFCDSGGDFPTPCPLPTSGEGVLSDIFGLSPQVPNPLAIDHYVVINPGAGWVSKRWPPTSIAAICDFLRQHEITPVLIGGPGEEPIAEEVARQTAAPPDILTGKTSIPLLIAVIAGARAHLGGDTGSTHLAAALGVPAVGLYSSTRPERSCPYGQIHRCLRDPNGLAHITVDQVRAKLSDALGL